MNVFSISLEKSTLTNILIAGVRIRIRMDSPILDPLDPDSPKKRIRIQGIFFGSKYEDFFIIDQISKKPWYFFTVN